MESPLLPTRPLEPTVNLSPDMEELLRLSAHEAAGRIAAGSLRVADYVDALLARGAAIGHLGAFLHQDAESLRAQARRLDAGPRPDPARRPLHGVPLLFKDNIDVAGLPTTAGSPWLADHVPRLDAGVTRRLREAGALVLGKANLHEWSQGVTGHNHAFGPARNPHDPARIAGGSSGGNAVALAAQAVPAAIGTDTGGSVRVPAALCGVVGFRPSIGRWPGEGLVPISPTFDTAGVMARCVADCRLIDGAVTGALHDSQARTAGSLRLGVPEAYFWERLDPGTEVVARAGLARLAEAGATLVPCAMGEAGALFRAGALSISLHEILPALQAYFDRHRRPFDPRALLASVVSPDVRPLFERLFGPERITPAAYAHALGTLRPRLQALYREVCEQHRLDALVFPTAPLPAARLGEEQVFELAGERVTAFDAYIRNSGPAGMAGVPSISLAAGVTVQGLPVGLELDGRAGADGQLLAVALAVEALLPGVPAARPAVFLPVGSAEGAGRAVSSAA